MSGLEFVAAIIGVAEVSSRASSKLWALFRTWRDAPEDLHRLCGDLTRTHDFFGEIKEGIGIHDPDSASAGQRIELFGTGQAQELHRLLREGTDIIRHLERIIDGLVSASRRSDGDVRDFGKRGRLYWTAGVRREAARQSKRLAEMRSSICRLLLSHNTILSKRILVLLEELQGEIQTSIADSTTLTLQHMDRTIWASQDRLLEQIDRRLVGTPVQRPPPYLESVLTKVVPAITSPPNVQESESATPIREFECNRGCRCPCHATKAYKLKFSLLRSAVGSFEVAYRCSKTPRSACQDRNCQRFGIVDAGFRDIVVVYTVPDWLARVTLSIFATSNLNGGPQMTIRVINRRPSDLLGAAGCVQSGDTAAVKWLLRTRQVSIYDVFGGDYRSLLWMAVWDRHIDIVKLLLQAGADPFAEMTASYRPPIQLVFTRWLAGSQIDEEIARLFPISEYLDRLEYSSLHLAILDILHLDLAQVLQDPSYAANIDAVGLNGLAPLHLAAIRGNVAATKHLLRFGATPDITDHQNRTPLQLSCAHAKLPVTRLLLRAGASPTKREEYGMIALHAAAGCPNKARTDDILSGLALLLQYGADINDRNYHGHTPLLSAVMGTTAAVEFLICHGADLNNRDKDGDVPLADAIMSLKYDTAALLLKSGADVAVYNNNGVGLLHFLASGADVEMMRVFTRSGRMAGKVSTAVKNNRGKTPMRLFTERQPPPSEELKKAWEELLENVEGGETSDWSDEGDEEFFDAEETVKAC